MQPQTPTTPGASSPDSQGFYNPDQQLPQTPAPDEQAQSVPSQTFEWEASEYVHHDKGALWLFALVIVTVVLAGIAFWLQAWTFVALIVVMGSAMGFFAFRPPRVLRYSLSATGVKVSGKFYEYSDFKSFGIIQEGAFFTMMLTPTKRFMPSISLYFAEADGDKIVDIVGSHLPMEDLKPDLIDSVMRRLRF